MVGEEGPELFVPDVSGEIIPNDVTARIVKDMAIQHKMGFDAGGMSDLSATITNAGTMDYNTNMSGNVSREDKVKIDVWLSPDLEGRIVDKALDEAAGVVVDIVNRRR